MNTRTQRRIQGWLQTLIILSVTFTLTEAVGHLLRPFGVDFSFAQRDTSAFHYVIGVLLLVSVGSSIYVARLLGLRTRQAENDELKEHRRAIERQAEELVRAKSLAGKEPKTL